MPLTSLPTRAPGIDAPTAIGGVKSNARPFTEDKRYLKIPADEYNRILSYLIDVCDTVGLTSGATPGSLWEAVLGGGGGTGLEAGIVASPDFFSSAGAFSTTTRVHVGSGTGYVRQLPAAATDYYSWTLVYTGVPGQTITIGRNGGSINGMLADYVVDAAEGTNRIVRIEGGAGGVWRVAEIANWPEVDAAITSVAGDLAALTLLVGAADGSTPGSAWEAIVQMLSGRNPNVQTVVGADILNATASLVLASGSGYAFSMPVPGSITMHREVRVLYTGTPSISLAGNGGTLNGSASVTLPGGAAGSARYAELVLRPGGVHFVSAPVGASAPLSVVGNGGATAGLPEELTTTAGSGAVLRESGGVLAFGAIASGGLAPNSVTDTILRDSQPLSVIGRDSNTLGDPADIVAGALTGPLRSTGTVLGFRKDNYAAVVAPAVGNDATQGYEIGSVWVDTVADRVYVATDVSAGAAVWRETSLAPGSVTDLILRDSAALSVIGRSANSAGDPADIAAVATSGAVLRESGSVIGFGTVATAGLGDDQVTNAKLRNSGALSVVGRSANSAGDPADISATAASDAVLRESASVLGFGTVATGGLANNAVTDAKLRQGAALTVVGRSANSLGNVADIAAVAASGAVLRESGSTLGFGTVATAGLAANAVTNTIIRDSGALSVIGRSVNSSGDPADISATAASGAVLRESASVLGFGTVATAGIADTAVTDAKLRNSTALTVIGRSANTAGVPADIAAVAASGAVLRESGSTLGFGTVATAGLADDSVTDAKLANMAALTVKANATNAAADPADLAASAGGNGVLRESGSTLGFGLVATANVATNAITNTLIRDSGALSVIGRSANSSGDPADIAATPASGAVLRESGSVLGFGTVATAGLGDDQVTDAKLRNSGALTVIGRAVNSSGDPADIAAGSNTGPLRSNASALAFRKDNYAAAVDPTATDDSAAGYEVGSVWINLTAQHLYRCSSATPTAATWIRLDNTDIDAGLLPPSSIEVASASTLLIAPATRYVRATYAAGTQTLTLRGLVDHPLGKQILLGHESTGTNSIVIQPDTGASIGGGAVDAPFTIPTSNTPASATTPDRLWVLVRAANTVWRVLGPGLIESTDLAANAVTNTALRDSGALSVIGRAANSSGDPADIATTAASNAVLKETGSTLAFGLVTTANVTANAVDNTLIRDSGALSVIGRSANSSGDPADIAAVAASGAVLRESGSVLGFGTVATAGLANDAVDNTKIRNSGALSVIGRSANTTGDPADISATATSGAVLRESGSVLGFGTVATAGLGDDQVTDAKLRNSSALSVIGRATNTSGDPADIAAGSNTGPLRSNGTAVAFRKDNYAAAVAPGVNDDSIAGYEIGSVWIDTTADRAYTATDVSAGAALWREISLAPNSVTNAILRDSGALSVIGRSVNSAGDPADISATAASGAVLRESGSVLGFGTVATAGLADANVTYAKIQNGAALSVAGRSANSAGVMADISAAAASGAVLREASNVLGFGTVATAGLANDAVDNTKIRNSGALSVIGRSANTTGDPADISAVAASNTVLKETGSTLAFGLVATANVTTNAIDNTLIRDSGALSVIGRSANTSGDPADISATAASDAVLRESGSVLGFGTVATGGIANDAIDNTKIRNSGALSVIGRSVNSAGDPADISATASSDQVLREAAGVLGFGTVATAGLANGVVEAKLAAASAAVAFNSQRLTLVADPVAAQDVATKAYVDAIAQNLDIKDSVRATSTTNITLSGPQVIDGVSIIAGDSVLVQGQTLGENNGIYLAAAGAWTRRSDADTSAKVTSGMFTFVTEGTAFGDNGYVLTTQDPIVLGTTPLVFTQFSGAGMIIAGAGLTKTGNTLDVVGANSSIQVNANSIQVGTNSIGNTLIRQGTALTVIGRSANSTGDVADIAAGAASGAVLREASNVIGFGTVATAGLGDDQVTDAKLRNSSALSVVGRSANTSGAPADISATAASGAVLRESGSTLGFGTVATAGLANSAVTYAKIQNGAALSVAGRSANSAGVMADITAVAASAAVLRESGSTIGFGTIATNGIANAAVTYAKIQNGGALSVAGRSANSSGAMANISATAASGAVLRESGSVLGFGTVATAGIANGAVTEAKVTYTTATVAGASATLTGASMTRITYAAGVCTLTLPASLTTWPIGTTNRLQKENASAFTIILTPDTGSTLQGGAANAPVTLPGSALPSSTTVGDMWWDVTRISATVWRFDGGHARYVTSSAGVGRTYYTIVVGNALEGDTLDSCNYLDPGDCTGLDAAITFGYNLKATIFVRRGTYTMPAAHDPWDLTTTMHILGEGQGQTIIRAPVGDASHMPWRMFKLSGAFCELSDFGIFVPDRAATVAAYGSTRGMIDVSAFDCAVRRVTVITDSDFTATDKALGVLNFPDATIIGGFVAEDVTLNCQNTSPVGHATNPYGIALVTSGEIDGTAQVASAYGFGFAEPVFTRMRVLGGMCDELANPFYTCGFLTGRMSQYMLTDSEFQFCSPAIGGIWSNLAGTTVSRGPRIDNVSIMDPDGLAAGFATSVTLSMVNTGTALEFTRCNLSRIRIAGCLTGAYIPGYVCTSDATVVRDFSITDSSAVSRVTASEPMCLVSLGTGARGTRLHGVVLETATGSAAPCVLTLQDGARGHIIDCTADTIDITGAADKTIVALNTARTAITDSGTNTSMTGNQIA